MHPLSCWIVYTKEVNFVPCRLVRPVYTVPANKPIQIPPLFRTGKNTNCTSEIRLFRPVNAYRTETRKRRRRRRKKKKKKTFPLSHLSTHQRHSQFLKLIAYGLSSLKLQIFLTNVFLLSFKFTFSFLFLLSSFLVASNVCQIVWSSTSLNTQ